MQNRGENLRESIKKVQYKVSPICFFLHNMDEKHSRISWKKWHAKLWRKEEMRAVVACIIWYQVSEGIFGALLQLRTSPAYQHQEQWLFFLCHKAYNFPIVGSVSGLWSTIIVMMLVLLCGLCLSSFHIIIWVTKWILNEFSQQSMKNIMDVTISMQDGDRETDRKGVCLSL